MTSFGVSGDGKEGHVRTKNLPLRLDLDLHGELKEVAAATGSTMVDIVRDALREYLPRIAERRASEMEVRLARLRAIAEQPGAMEAAIQAIAEAESQNPDPLQQDAVVADVRTLGTATCPCPETSHRRSSQGVARGDPRGA
jgi:hypothetical protein